MFKSFITSLFDFNKGEQDRELMSFCRSEFKNDADWAYDSLKRTRTMPVQPRTSSFQWQ